MKRLFFLLLVMTVCNFADGVKLQYKYEKGKPLFYELMLENVSSFVTPDSEQREMRMETRIVTKQELMEELADGSVKIAMTILEATQKIDGVEKPFPSAQNQTQIITMQKNGGIISMLTPYPGQAPEQNTPQMVFPDKPLTAGETWTSIKDISYPIPVETRTLYKVTELTSRLATISSMMKLQNTGGDDINADTEGRTVFDHVSGKTIRSTADSRFQFEIPVRVPGLLPNNSNVKVNLRMQIKINEITVDETPKEIVPDTSKEKVE
jgi:hypothetical protein